MELFSEKVIENILIVNCTGRVRRIRLHCRVIPVGFFYLGAFPDVWSKQQPAV